MVLYPYYALFQVLVLPPLGALYYAKSWYRNRTLKPPGRYRIGFRRETLEGDTSSVLERALEGVRESFPARSRRTGGRCAQDEGTVKGRSSQPRWPMAVPVAAAVAIIGAALDLGAGRRGVDMGPSAIRYAGLHGQLASAGIDVEDRGNVETPLAETRAAGRRARALPRRDPGDLRAVLDRGRAGSRGRPRCRSCSAATTRSRSARSAGWPRTGRAEFSGSTPTAT